MSRSKVRYAWADTAKGLCMVLVVLLHVSHWYEADVQHGGPWWVISEILAPLRMPLFFFISGFLAATALRRPLVDSRKRTYGLFYLYVIWTLVNITRQQFSPGQTDAFEVSDVIASLALPTLYWYIWALPVFFAVTLGLVRLMGTCSVYVLAPLAALSAASPLISQWSLAILPASMDEVQLGAVASNFVWFYLGAHGVYLWLKTMDGATLWKAGAGVAVYAALYVLASMLGLVNNLKIILAPVALFVAAQALALCRHDTALGRLLERIGKSTLPIYIFHFLAIAAFGVAANRLGVVDAMQPDSALWAIVLPPALAATIIFLSILAGKLISQSPMPWLLEAPPWATRPLT